MISLANTTIVLQVKLRRGQGPCLFRCVQLCGFCLRRDFVILWLLIWKFVFEFAGQFVDVGGFAKSLNLEGCRFHVDPSVLA